MTSTIWRIVLVLVLVLVLDPRAFAQEPPNDSLPYRVRPGDTLDVIAAESYGDKTLAMFIATENKLIEGKQAKPRALRPGERLRIPAAREIATAKGDQLETLAQSYLGDSHRASFLGDYNAIAPDRSLPTGSVLVVPMHVTHVATAPESLAAVSLAYFGDPKQAELLKRYNGLDKTSLEKGDAIVVPALRVHPAKTIPLGSDDKERRDHHAKAVAGAADALARAKAAWMLGDFAGVKTALADSAGELDYVDTDVAVEIGLLLGKAHCAFDEQDAAVAAFAQVRERKPSQTLTTYADSPKVLSAWRKAGGHVDGE